MLSHRLRAKQSILGGIDSYVVLMLHMNGADASTTFTDEIGHTMTAAGNAQIDTAQSKFGGASGVFDGTGDYVSANDSGDWTLDGGTLSNVWTIDMWVRFGNIAADSGFVGHKADGNNYWVFLWNEASSVLRFRQKVAGTNNIDVNISWSPSTNTWYHIALTKDSSGVYKFYVNGTSIGSATDTTPLNNFAGTLRIGDANGNYMNGWIDELRISKGIARWTSNFTPPTAAYY